MATFVLIHGSWHGGWCFDPVAEILKAAGHEVDAPDLPGMGGTDAELAGVTLSRWSEFAVERCRAARTGPVILAGHSRGGLVLSEAAECDPQAMDALVYIAAMMLPDGFSRTQWKEHQIPNPAFDGIIHPHPSGLATIVDGAAGASVFAQLSPPDLVASATARLVAEPNAPRVTPLSLTAERYGSVPRHYIACAQDRTIPLVDQQKMMDLQTCVSTTVLDADHSPFFSAPGPLVEALMKIAENAQR